MSESCALEKNTKADTDVISQFPLCAVSPRGTQESIYGCYRRVASDELYRAGGETGTLIANVNRMLSLLKSLRGA